MTIFEPRAMGLGLSACLLLAPSAQAESLTRQQFLSQALRAHPASAQARARQTATESAAAEDGRWMNPMLELDLAPLSLGTEPGYMARFKQPLTYGPGVRSARQGRQLAVSTGQAQLQADSRTLQYELNALWFETLRSHEAEHIASDHLILVQKLTTAVAGALATGRARPDALYMAQSQQWQAERNYREARAEREALDSEIALLLTYPARGILLSDVDTTNPTIPFNSAESLAQALVSGSPELQAMRTRVAQSRQIAAARSWSGVPAMALMAGYDSMQPMAEHRIQVGLELELPVANGEKRAQGAMANAETAMQEAELQQAELRVRVEALQMWSELTTTLTTLHTLRTQQIPLADRRIQSMSAMIATGDVDLAALIPALRERLEWQLDTANMLAMARKIQQQILIMTATE